MKSLTMVTAFLLVCIVAISQVWAAPTEPMEGSEGVTPPMRVEQPEVTTGSCAPTMDIDQAHRNLMMAVCEQMQPGFIQNMMGAGAGRNVVQNLGRRDEAHPAQFPPFPPFPPPLTFPPFPPFAPGTSGLEANPAQFPPFPPFPPPPTFPPFPPFPPGGRGRGN